MIGYLRGVPLNSTNPVTVLNQSGLGLEIYVVSPDLIVPGKELVLHTYFNWNQENGPSLYGFITEEEKKIFMLVISCSGIGPKIGLAVLGQMQPKDFIRAIHEQDIKSLSCVNGIGAKKAEQIIVQLKHKVADILQSGITFQDAGNMKHFKDISEALNSLNYSRQEVTKALDFLRGNSGEDASFDHMLRQALSFLSKRI